MKTFLQLFLALIAISGAAHAEPIFLRWTAADSPLSDLTSVLTELSARSGFAFDAGHFIRDEDRDLAFNHYQRYTQLHAGLRVENHSLRIWTGPDGALVQAEANVEDPATIVVDDAHHLLRRMRIRPDGLRSFDPLFSDDELKALAKRAIATTDDAVLRSVRSEDFVSGGRLIRKLTVRAKYGEHIITFALPSKTIIAQRYRPFPNAEMSVQAKVFPIYEEYGGQILPRRDVTLRHILRRVKRPDGDPYVRMRSRRYLQSTYDDVRAKTPEGLAAGYWSDASVRSAAQAIEQGLPVSHNSFAQGVLLQGRYATININPDAFAHIQDITLARNFSSHFYGQWIDVTPAGGEEEWEMIPTAMLLGKPFFSRSELYHRPATRDPQHNPAVYMNEGFDEVQVYYAINQLFDSLHAMGFSDPELSTRPFHAILFDPAIGSKDNAYYENDTINFSTYSPGELNFARDNTTIWHELGHGVMDRLMGAVLNLADTGGLSEGMADFVAALVIDDVTQGQAFPGSDVQRIINRTGFYLTNEVHDDGEAYGGAMQDMLNAAKAQWGRDGLHKMTDLTLETMRLTRDHPHLTAADWFEHMEFADVLGRPGVRQSGEFAMIIHDALVARNFSSDLADLASFKISFDGQPVEAGEPGSRGRSIPNELTPTQWKHFDIVAQVDDGAATRFNYPVTVKVQLRGGPLQGAVQWRGQDAAEAEYVFHAPGEQITIPLDILGTCDYVNRDDGGCSDFAYLKVFNAGQPDQPVGKKRFYVKVKTLP